MLELDLVLKVASGLLTGNILLLAWIGRLVWSRLDRLSERLGRVETALTETVARARSEAELAALRAEVAALRANSAANRITSE